jgi:hypothetical protein
MKYLSNFVVPVIVIVVAIAIVQVTVPSVRVAIPRSCGFILQTKHQS